jgi:alpha-1,2-mannosyltransferase
MLFFIKSGIVECMAAGLIMVANKSGGPLMDIVTQAARLRNGFLASDELEYAQVIQNILSLSSNERSEIRVRARKSVDRFSESEFSKGFLNAVTLLVK